MQQCLPHFSRHTAPLGELLKKNQTFNWEDNMNTTFQKLISMAHSTPLQCFQTDPPVILQADDSKHGLSTCLLQKGKPIFSALKAMPDAAIQCLNTEMKLLAVVYTCEHFHTYLYSCYYMVETDHKPLEMITLWNLTTTLFHLQ